MGVGIAGIKFSSKPSQGLVVSGVVGGSAAEQGKILPHDRIVAIDGLNITAMKAQEAVALISGAPKSSVQLGIERVSASRGMELFRITLCLDKRERESLGESLRARDRDRERIGMAASSTHPVSLLTKVESAAAFEDSFKSNKELSPPFSSSARSFLGRSNSLPPAAPGIGL